MFGSFRVLHQIGSGVLGPVFRTFDPQRDRLVAVKAFRLNEVVPEDIARLADALRRLSASAGNLPVVVAPVEAGLEGTTAYLAMEYVAAETLDVLLRHLAPAPLDRAVGILAPIAEAIDEAAAAGLTHGALHPRDVFVTADGGEVRVSGFGIVPALEALRLKAPIRRPYTAPERAAGRAWDTRADVYSLGVLAHELLTGRRPAGPAEQDGALAAGTTPEQRVGIRRVLSAALAEDPAHRFASARALVDALSAVLRGEPAVVPDVPLVADPCDVSAAEPDAGTEDVIPSVSEVEVAQDPPPSAEAVVAPTVEAATRDRAADPIVSPGLVEPDEEPGEADTDRVTGPADARGDDTTRPARPRRRRPVAEPWSGALMAAEPPAADTPWLAMAAVLLAGIVIGLVGGFQWGARRPPSVEAPPQVAAPQRAASAPTGTDVAVPEPPPPAPAPNAPPPTAPRPAAPASGRLLIRTTPAGATVTIDGRSRGVTPATVRDLPFGTHTVQVARPGYVTRSQRVTLSAASPARDLTVELSRVAGASATPAGPTAPARPTAVSGSVFIDSNPRGARVAVDGRALGVTPMGVPDLSPGPHTVRFELAGHKPLTTRVTVVAGKQATVRVSLEPEERR